MATKQENTKEENKCVDLHCAIHNSVKTHGRAFIGTVIEAKAQKTATVEWARRYYLPKYERHEKRRTRVKAHNPECMNANKGEIVKIAECRPLSKTKHFVIVEKLGKNLAFMEKEQLLEEAKFKPAKKESAKIPEEVEKNESD